MAGRRRMIGVAAVLFAALEAGGTGCVLVHKFPPLGYAAVEPTPKGRVEPQEGGSETPGAGEAKSDSRGTATPRASDGAN